MNITITYCLLHEFNFFFFTCSIRSGRRLDLIQGSTLLSVGFNFFNLAIPRNSKEFLFNFKFNLLNHIKIELNKHYNNILLIINTFNFSLQFFNLRSVGWIQRSEFLFLFLLFLFLLLFLLFTEIEFPWNSMDKRKSK